MMLFEVLPGLNPPIKSKIKRTNDLVSNYCYVGVEIELEGMPYWESMAEDLHGHWRVKADGSLRGDYPMEFYFKQPWRGKDVVNALELFEDSLENRIKPGYPPICSYRTSVHVHLDVRRFTFQDLMALGYFSVVYEPLLYGFAGNTRKLSNFCVPWSPGLISNVISFVSEIYTKGRTNFYLNDTKYLGCNFTALLNLGSVEFRQLPGTTDTRRILSWINILQRIWLLSRRSAGNLRAHLNRISQHGIRTVSEQDWGPQWPLVEPHFDEGVLLDACRSSQHFIAVPIKKQVSPNPMEQNSVTKLFNQGKPVPNTYKVNEYLSNIDINALRPARNFRPEDLIEDEEEEF